MSEFVHPADNQPAITSGPIFAQHKPWRAERYSGLDGHMANYRDAIDGLNLICAMKYDPDIRVVEMDAFLPDALLLASICLRLALSQARHVEGEELMPKL